MRTYQAYADQDRPPEDPYDRRYLRLTDNHDGTGDLHGTTTTAELDELRHAIQAFLDLLRRQHHAAASAEAATDPTSEADTPTPTASAEAAGPTTVDALLAMAHTALAHLHGVPAAPEDQYLIHLIHHPNGDTTLTGDPVDPTTAAASCTAPTVTHHHGPDGEPLDVGRKTRTWNTGQRRAVLVRDHGTCRFPHCPNHTTHIHHHQPWAAGGPTSVTNGYLLCPRHHTLIHNGYAATGAPNGTLTFHRPDGTTIASTSPSARGRAA